MFINYFICFILNDTINKSIPCRRAKIPNREVIVKALSRRFEAIRIPKRTETAPLKIINHSLDITLRREIA